MMLKQFNLDLNDELIADSIDCIAEQIGDESQSQYLIGKMDDHKSHTLVLDIDETLLSVRRWIDEVQINDAVQYILNDAMYRVTKMSKEVTLQYDDGQMSAYSFYFTEQQPFAQLSSPLDVGDRMDIGGRLASVKEVMTSYITIVGGDDNKEIQIACFNDDYLQQVRYADNGHHENGKFAKPDLVHNNMYLVRFRDGLCDFFKQMLSYKNLEIVLWTAAVRKVYTELMKEVETELLSKMKCGASSIWTDILFRDNCTSRPNGSYYKDLSLIGRDYNRIIMVDNISFNFQDFEYNGLPIQEYWGHINDTELPKLCNIMNDIVCVDDVRTALHPAAFKHSFSTYKLDSMLNYLRTKHDALTSNEQVSDDKEEEDGADSMPTALTSATTNTSTEDEDDKHLDFYLFNMGLDGIDDIEFDVDVDLDYDDHDDQFLNDMDPTILFNANYH